MFKKLRIPVEEVVELIPDMGICLASDKVMVDGLPVGYMYRDEPEEEGDSGWVFLSGTEDQDYMDDEDNLGIYEVNTVANYDRDIIPYLKAPAGAEFEKNEDGSYSRLKPE